MPELITRRATRHDSKTADLTQVKNNLEVIQSALCSQALLCRFDSGSSSRLLDIAGEIENISDVICGGRHE